MDEFLKQKFQQQQEMRFDIFYSKLFFKGKFNFKISNASCNTKQHFYTFHSLFVCDRVH